MVLFISASRQPLPWSQCALGLDFNQMGPWQSGPGGPHGSNAPLEMINEPTDSHNVAQLLWGVACVGEEGVFSPVPGSCHRGPSPPPVPDNNLASPSSERNSQERQHHACPTTVLLLGSQGWKEIGRATCPYCCLGSHFYLGISWP